MRFLFSLVVSIYKMEFKEIGRTVRSEPPSDDLKPFFRRKFKTVYRTLEKCGGTITKNDTALWADRAANYISDPEERANYVAAHMKMYEKWTLFGKDRINEKEYVECMMKVVYADSNSRKETLKEWWKNMPYYFDQLDLNKDGFIDEEETRIIRKIFGCSEETHSVIFNAMDADGDGVISMKEYGYAVMSFYFDSGPDDILSTLFGPMIPEETS